MGKYSFKNFFVSTFQRKKLIQYMIFKIIASTDKLDVNQIQELIFKEEMLFKQKKLHFSSQKIKILQTTLCFFNRNSPPHKKTLNHSEGITYYILYITCPRYFKFELIRSICLKI